MLNGGLVVGIGAGGCGGFVGIPGAGCCFYLFVCIDGLECGREIEIGVSVMLNVAID